MRPLLPMCRLVTPLAVALALAGAAQAQAPRVGKPLAAFAAQDALTGQALKLEDLRGSIVLVDFWATWCGPCVAELPNVKKAYQKYHDQGFEIVSISLDNDVAKCKAFVKTQQMAWRHVIEGGGWNSRLAKQYGIQAIPAAFVLDANGVIVAEEARGERLAVAIETAMKKTPPKPGGAHAAADADNKLAQAKALLAKKDYVAAATALEALRKDYPGTEAAKQAAQQLEEMKQDPAAKNALEQAAAEKKGAEASKQAENLLGMARGLAKAGNFEAARKKYERVSAEFPDSPQAKIAQAEIEKLPK
jgi:thiol-disulfide isomerase/thioredoxin